MNDSDSSMPLSRQLCYQKQCRENWKENALKKQEKIREYVQSNRALKKSRDCWKARAKEAEQKIKDLEKQLAQFSPSPDLSSANCDENDEESEIIPHHHYRISTISVVVQQFIKVGNSFRGAAKTMQLISSHSQLDTPHYSSVKNWMEKIGLFELLRPKQRRDDWLFIVDLTIELGKSKALVIYGISYQDWQLHNLRNRSSLKPTDGQILALEVTTEATGAWIYGILESVSQSVGIPLQIIADRASNLRKGIQLFQDRHQKVIYTYDVTHAMANLLKKELFGSECFQNFLADCHSCRLHVQQTELAFAAPPAQRSQCRYFNLDRLVNWSLRMFQCDLTFLARLLPNLSFPQFLARWQQKFSWLEDYYEPICFWRSLLFLTRTLEKQLKSFGLHQASLLHYSQKLSLHKISHFTLPFKQKIFSYLQEQILPCFDHTFLATSDVLESLFGRYKYFSQRCPIKELRSLLLTIPLSTVNFNHEFVKEALTTVHVSDLSQWIQHTFGQSNLSKRKLLFGH
ncbi:hypothetical protein [Chroococcus sp. FPU101]|uniref:hypothetical protein n=1 Tax=Chroococcus sp. FPU101 TaxID=1974212 RepID=UPI001AA5A1D6|nr:hypothetical protein [Chroococcus sp. FPU101]GFE72278.1 hypothetical protein CFPU101_48880 [Chroococcus sp. FPU101]